MLSRSHQLFNLTYIWKSDELNYVGFFYCIKNASRANTVEIWAFSLTYFLTGNIDRLPRVDISFFRLFSFYVVTVPPAFQSHIYLKVRRIKLRWLFLLYQKCIQSEHCWDMSFFAHVFFDREYRPSAKSRHFFLSSLFFKWKHNTKQK